MAIYGRLLREAARDRALETPERVAERIRRREAAERVRAEFAARYPDGLNETNVEEAIEWQARRLREEGATS
jgi:hypothetical protein